MKTNAHKAKDYKFTADLWHYSSTTDAEGGEVRTYSFARKINLKALSGTFGKMKLYFPEDCADVINGMRLYNFCDAAGTEMQTNAIWEIDQFQPDLNMWGIREGFTARGTWNGIDA